MRITERLHPVEDDPPMPREMHYDANPRERFMREWRGKRIAMQEIRDTETPEARDDRLFKLWVNYDGVTFTDRHLTVDEVRRDAKRLCASTCPCWRHSVIAHWERIHP